MEQDIERARLLMRTGRFDMAETLLRECIAQDASDPEPRALLALTLANLDRYREAMDEARHAISMNPEQAGLHFILAALMHDTGNYLQAMSSIDEALRLNADDIRFFRLKAGIHLAQAQWKDAIRVAEQGLRIDPENVDCENTRAIALVKSGQPERAAESLQNALMREPDNAMSHANRGWANLHLRKYDEAMDGFREALRLQPDFEWAREGIIESFRARSRLYRPILAYFLWMSRLPPRIKMFMVLGLFILARIARTAMRSDPDHQIIWGIVGVLYVIWLFLSWTAVPMFNLMLRMDKVARRVLLPDEIRASNLVGLCLGLAITSGIAAALTHARFLIAISVFALFLLIPTAGIFSTRTRRHRAILTGMTVLMLISAVAAVVMIGSDIPEFAYPIVAFGSLFLLFTVSANSLTLRG